MNVVLNISDFSIENVFFLEKKTNIVFNGVFTKIMYSNELFLMNGIYFKFPLEIQKINENPNKIYALFQVYNKINIKTVQEFTGVELSILEQYKRMNNCNKKINNSLSKQMYSGFVKIFCVQDNKNPVIEPNTTVSFVMKISGVWETNDEIGITYKLYRS